jgi:hypothetical protein
MQAAEQRRYVIVATGMKDQPRGSVHHGLQTVNLVRRNASESCIAIIELRQNE